MTTLKLQLGTLSPPERVDGTVRRRKMRNATSCSEG